jgi:NAD(P)-dependent dehydrogenase (short-subunit alcohol dehydrogenase family)
MDLNGKVALITGGAHRLGRAIALALVGEGAHLALHYHRSADLARATAAEAELLGAEVALLPADLARVAEAERLIDAAGARFGRLDLLVLSAAIFFPTPLGEVREAEWDALFDTNLKGPFFCAQRAAPLLRADGGGAIITLLDTGIYMAWRNYTPYLMTKAALATLTRQLAKELAPDVRVNGIAPGPVLLPDDASPERIARSEGQTLLGRLGHPDEIARAALYLAQSNYVTGTVLPVDGGQRWR